LGQAKNFASGNIPNPDGFVRRTGNQLAAVGRKVQTIHGSPMTRKFPDRFTRGRIPQLNAPVVAARRQPFSIRADGHSEHCLAAD
jgi:hypothetical protein